MKRWRWRCGVRQPVRAQVRRAARTENYSAVCVARSGPGVKQLSHRAILLVGGRIHAQGEPNQVINQYIGLVLEKQRAETAPRGKLAAGFRHGDLTSEVLDVQLLGEHGEPLQAVSSGEALRVRVRCVFHEAKTDPMVGILIRNGSDGRVRDEHARGAGGAGRIRGRRRNWSWSSGSSAGWRRSSTR